MMRSGLVGPTTIVRHGPGEQGEPALHHPVTRHLFLVAPGDTRSQIEAAFAEPTSVETPPPAAEPELPETTGPIPEAEWIEAPTVPPPCIADASFNSPSAPQQEPRPPSLPRRRGAALPLATIAGVALIAVVAFVVYPLAGTPPEVPALDKADAFTPETSIALEARAMETPPATPEPDASPQPAQTENLPSPVSTESRPSLPAVVVNPGGARVRSSPTTTSKVAAADRLPAGTPLVPLERVPDSVDPKLGYWFKISSPVEGYVAEWVTRRPTTYRKKAPPAASPQPANRSASGVSDRQKSQTALPAVVVKPGGARVRSSPTTTSKVASADRLPAGTSLSPVERVPDSVNPKRGYWLKIVSPVEGYVAEWLTRR